MINQNRLFLLAFFIRLFILFQKNLVKALGAFCTYEYIRKLKKISDERDLEIAAEVERGITCNIHKYLIQLSCITIYFRKKYIIIFKLINII